MTKVVNPTKVITGKVRFSYCNILEAKILNINHHP